jgi:hypothetical protein
LFAVEGHLSVEVTEKFSKCFVKSNDYNPSYTECLGVGVVAIARAAGREHKHEIRQLRDEIAEIRAEQRHRSATPSASSTQLSAKDRLSMEAQVNRTLSDRIPVLHQGADVSLYCKRVMENFRKYGSYLTEFEKIELVRRKVEHFPQVASIAESRLASRNHVRLQDYLYDLEKLFKPNTHAFTSELEGKKQAGNQACVPFVKEIRELLLKHWVPPPFDVGLLRDIIKSFSDKHEPFMRERLLNAINSLTDDQVISFDQLEKWAAQSDANYLATRARSTPVYRPPHLSGNPRAAFADARGSGRERGRGRSGGYERRPPGGRQHSRAHPVHVQHADVTSEVPYEFDQAFAHSGYYDYEEYPDYTEPEQEEEFVEADLDAFMVSVSVSDGEEYVPPTSSASTRRRQVVWSPVEFSTFEGFRTRTTVLPPTPPRPRSPRYPTPSTHSHQRVSPKVSHKRTRPTREFREVDLDQCVRQGTPPGEPLTVQRREPSTEEFIPLPPDSDEQDVDMEDASPTVQPRLYMRPGVSRVSRREYRELFGS